MKLIALTIGSGQSTYPIVVPGDIAHLVNLNLQDIVTFALSLLLFAAILLSFFFILFGGLKWMLSQGDKKQLEEAQKTILYAIIGLVLILLSFFILNLIGFVFQVPLIGH